MLVASGYRRLKRARIYDSGCGSDSRASQVQELLSELVFTRIDGGLDCDSQCFDGIDPFRHGPLCQSSCRLAAEIPAKLVLYVPRERAVVRLTRVSKKLRAVLFHEPGEHRRVRLARVPGTSARGGPPPRPRVRRAITIDKARTKLGRAYPARAAANGNQVAA